MQLVEDLLSVDHLDEADAHSLATRLSSSAGVTVEVREAEDFCVHVAGDGGALAPVLHAVEEWAGLAGVGSVCVRLDGRSYALEGRRNVDGRYLAETSR